MEHVAVGDVATIVHAYRSVDGGDVYVLVGVSSEEVIHGDPDDADLALGDQVAVLVTDVDDFTGVDAPTECGICGELFGSGDGDRARFRTPIEVTKNGLRVGATEFFVSLFDFVSS